MSCCKYLQTLILEVSKIEARMSLDETHIDELLAHVIRVGFSELHLDVYKPPIMGQIGSDSRIELTKYVDAQPQNIQSMVYDILSDEQIVVFENEHNLTFFYSVPSIARFCVFVVRDAGNVAVSFLAMQ